MGPTIPPVFRPPLTFRTSRQGSCSGLRRSSSATVRSYHSGRRTASPRERGGSRTLGCRPPRASPGSVRAADGNRYDKSRPPQRGARPRSNGHKQRRGLRPERLALVGSSTESSPGCPPVARRSHGTALLFSRNLDAAPPPPWPLRHPPPDRARLHEAGQSTHDS